MKFLLSLAALAATCSALAQGTAEAILGYDAHGTIAYVNTTTVGWTFQSTNALLVTELGCFAKVFDNNPAVTSVQVGLWDDGGSLLASSFVTSDSILFDQTRYESITPLSLPPDQVYHLGIYYFGGGIGIEVAGPSTGGSVSVSSAIQLGGLAEATYSFAYPPALSGTTGSIYAGPNFQFLSQPILTIQCSTNNQVRLSWSTVAPGYTVQAESTLSGTWTNASLSISLVGSEFVAYDTIGAGVKYYRLIK